jgi:hypothetical protein
MLHWSTLRHATLRHTVTCQFGAPSSMLHWVILRQATLEQTQFGTLVYTQAYYTGANSGKLHWNTLRHATYFGAHSGMILRVTLTGARLERTQARYVCHWNTLRRAMLEHTCYTRFHSGMLHWSTIRYASLGYTQASHVGDTLRHALDCTPACYIGAHTGV